MMIRGITFELDLEEEIRKLILRRSSIAEIIRIEP